MSFWKNPEPVTYIDLGDGREYCSTHNLKLNDDGTCPADSPKVDPIQIGDVWRDNGVDDTVTITSTAHDAKGRVTDVAGRFGDGSGPCWYTRDGFLNDCVPIAMETPMPLPDPPAYQDDDLIWTSATLNPDDPFEAVILEMVETNRRKRADYAIDGSPWSNFDDVAISLGIDGFTPVDSANFNIEQKSARLRSLRKNGRMEDPANESVADTYLDRAVYAVIALAMHKYPSGRVA